jgi:signal transduction histidine kinase
VADWSKLLQITEVTDSQDRVVLAHDWPLARALRGEQGSGHVYQVKREGRVVCRMECSFYPLRDESDHSIGAVVIARDVSQDLKLQTQLQESRRALRSLVAKQNRVTEKERKRIARELHDELQQQLGAIRMDVAEMARLSDRDPAAVQALAELTSGIVDQALEATRRIVNDLRPQILDDLGLPAALSAIAAQFHRRTHVECEFELIGPEERGALLHPDVATCLFRVTQEALNNVRKHAKATYVYVMLDLSHPHEAHLQVVDDGVGVDPKARQGSKKYGLLGMEERLDALGGQLRVTPGPQGGTCIDARVSLGELQFD